MPHPTVRVHSTDTALKVMKRRWKDADVYLLFNEGAKPCNREVTLSSKGRSVQVWDAQTGTVAPVASTRTAGGLAVHLQMQPYATRFLVVR